MSHILEVAQAEAARAAAGGGSYGGGYAIFGQPPVFPNARGSVERIPLTKPSRQDMDDIHLSDRLAELIEDEIDDPTGDALLALYDTCGNAHAPIDKLKADCEADNFDDWLRLILRCPVADADAVVLNFRHWAAKHLERKADEYGWTERAEKLLIEESAE
jgi:hypothetical protein